VKRSTGNGLWQAQGKRQEAVDLLAPVYGWFTEGFDTAALEDVKSLFIALNASLPGFQGE
jgi:hypothetical protein